MPFTAHKTLVHSSEVFKICILPIGQLSKESQEAKKSFVDLIWICLICLIIIQKKYKGIYNIKV